MSSIELLLVYGAFVRIFYHRNWKRSHHNESIVHDSRKCSPWSTQQSRGRMDIHITNAVIASVLAIDQAVF